MTAIEKANDLYSKYHNLLNKEFGNDIVCDNDIKECVLIAVDELIIQENKYNNGSFYPSKYWQEVKQEIKYYDITE